MNLRPVRLLACSLALALAAAACGGDDDEPAATGTTAPTGEPAAVGQIAGGYMTVGVNNFVVGVTDGVNPQSGAQVEITFFDNVNTPQQKERFRATPTQSAPGVGPAFVHIHAGGEHIHGGEDENRAVYYARVTFDHPGAWGASIAATLEDGTTGITNVAFEVTDGAPVPLPGEPAIASDNLTTADVADISEIDSGTPPNDMHDVKIKDALAAGRPLVIVFSTPAYCTTQFCGPVNEEVEVLQDKYRDAVDFVHIEIWRDFTTKEFNPTAREWLVEPDGFSHVEPVVYIVDSKGIIYDRYEGPVAANILEPAVEAVASGKTFE